MEKNKKPGSMMKSKNEVTDSGGMFEYWEKVTYNKNLYYVNTSGFVCRLPDQEEAISEVSDALLAERRDLT